MSSPWYILSSTAVADALDVDIVNGLPRRQVIERTGRHGSNVLAAAASTPAWKKLLQLLSDKMTIVLLLAAIVSAVVTREWETPVVILIVVVFNTILNYVQVARAENSLAALRKMSVATSRVRRDGQVEEIDRSELVPGDVVLLEAGDSVPADGRVVQASQLQVAEANLTGESQPVDKDLAPTTDLDAPLGDRSCMVFMNTEVTRGRGTMIVTDTGMKTEMGAIAEQLASTGESKTPLQRRIDRLARLLTLVALVVVAIVFVLGLLRGESIADLLLTAVSLAVATIPEGLTAVVAFTLAMGANRLATQGAIIKQLSAVETLGSTSHIATDKTGTLTLNEMTVHRLLVDGHTFRVTGRGYSTDGRVLSPDHSTPDSFPDAYLSMALCNDASVSDGRLVGDPTDGALVVLAEKGGLDVDGARLAHPRLQEVPFDSVYKFQATFHHQTFRIGDTTAADYRIFVKGAPGIVLKRATSVLGANGPRPLTEEDRDRILASVDELADEGLRTLMIAGRTLEDGAPGATSLPEDGESLRELATDLTLYCVVGITDPPRQEAAEAIKIAQGAGISVHMITGDHLRTASAIAKSLNIPGNAASGSDLDEIDDDALRDHAPGFGVLARVAPEHKIRFVKALQRRGEVVAMTGDGVNDAPALKQADIGIAMGITGTDVSKGAARMILTDDNFATIVAAVREGRGIYDNILKFVRFQLSTSWGFVMLFLICGVLGIAGGAPFTALQILWVNIIMDGPPALALGVERTEPDVMRRPPRPAQESLLTCSRMGHILLAAATMTAGTLAVLLLASTWFPDIDSEGITTLAFTTFVFFQVFNLLNVRSEAHTVFSARTLTNGAIWISLAVVFVLQIAVVHAPVLQGLFDTTALTAAQWLTAAVIGSLVLWVEELRKVSSRRRAAKSTLTMG
ncbi:cation-translocating P-type ATPase [Cryobacterium lactosi]|uniref:Cation-translocating P-type ATPase n=1 Tax=Cryobacterium lactosi TaxID=1259202 RepID=A0A4R9BX30_9MICO|nr:cation-translocating P-type ATPase [Cryobacterium lactosi]TFD92956.1 cation-translocating P-type ATPase [Cryobacterium lactosi]